MLKLHELSQPTSVATRPGRGIGLFRIWLWVLVYGCKWLWVIVNDCGSLSIVKYGCNGYAWLYTVEMVGHGCEWF